MFLTVNGANGRSSESLETGCYVSDRMTADDMQREAIKLAEHFGFKVPDDMRAIVDGEGWCDNPDDGESLTDLCDYHAVPFLCDQTEGGYWTFDGELGGFYLFADDEDDDSPVVSDSEETWEVRKAIASSYSEDGDYYCRTNDGELCGPYQSREAMLADFTEGK